MIIKDSYLINKRNELNAQLKSIDSKLAQLPSGKLICTCNGSRFKWYVSDGHNTTYIPKSNRQFAEQLAAKKYYKLMHHLIEKEIKAINSYFKYHVHDINQEITELLNSPRYKDLLAPIFDIQSDELKQWVEAPYEHNPKYSEQLVVKAPSGNYVRSKSESLIDMVLHTNKIPFRYECALHLGNATFYPDFTIRHPQTGNIFYWEHFGLMNNQDYINSTYSKLKTYALNGIVESIQLITTFETPSNPLTYDAVNSIVQQYFL